MSSSERNEETLPFSLLDCGACGERGRLGERHRCDPTKAMAHYLALCTQHGVDPYKALSDAVLKLGELRMAPGAQGSGRSYVVMCECHRLYTDGACRCPR